MLIKLKIYMKLSIIIPVYKVEKYIARCLESIYCQNFSINHFEVILVNDGTPDKSVAIISEFLDLYSNIFLINQSNQGLSAARNTGLDIAIGKYVWFIDSDDWIVNGSLQNVFSTIERGYPLIATTLIYSYDITDLNFPERIVKNSSFIHFSDYITKYSVGASQRYIIKKELIDKFELRFLVGFLHEDAHFNVRLLYFAKEVLLLKEPIYHYYQGNQDSIMSTWKIKNSEDLYRIFLLLTDFWKKEASIPLNISLRVFTFKVLLMSVPLRRDIEFRLFYKRIRNTLRIEAAKIFVTKSISIRQRFMFAMCIFSPYLFKRIMKP